ncbi:hypothetical protein GCM10020219_079720 [Nonomuraea dietziae]
MFSGSRLVASTRTRWHSARIRSTSSAARLDEVLAVVEDERDAMVAEGRHQRVDRRHSTREGHRRRRVLARGRQRARWFGVAVRQAERGEHRQRDVAAGAERGQLDEAHLPEAVGRLDRLDGQPRLARAAGPRERQQTASAEQPADQAKLVVAPDEAGQPRSGRPGPQRRRRAEGLSGDGRRRQAPHGERAGGGGGRGHGGGWFVAQQAQVEGGQLGRGVGAQLLGQRLARLLEHLQRLCPAPRPGQGEHELTSQPLPQRLPPHQLAQLGDQLGERGAAREQVGLDPVLHGREAQLLQRGGLRLGEGQRQDVGQRGTAPQAERLTQQPRPLTR